MSKGDSIRWAVILVIIYNAKYVAWSYGQLPTLSHSIFKILIVGAIISFPRFFKQRN